MHESTAIVQVTAVTMQHEVLAAYPEGPTGNLKRGVVVKVEQTDRAGISARVESRAKHAWWNEHGTGPRVWNKKRPNGKSTGRMPAKPVFIDIAIARRRVMTRALIGVVERAGLTVSGSAE
jgi:hypothetical protein